MTRCFMHIPKCAGSSVHAALARAVPASDIAPWAFDKTVFCDVDDFGILPADFRSRVAITNEELARLGAYDYVGGHFSLPTLEAVSDPAQIVTVLREPRSRLLSLYAYWRIADFSALAPYRSHEYAYGTLAELLAEPVAAPSVDNQMCRFVLDGDDRIPQRGFIKDRDVENLATETLERLDQLGFVGVQERMGEAWAGLEKVLGVTLARTRENVTAPAGIVMSPPPGGLVTAEAMDLLDARSAADDIVYREILGRLEGSEQAANRVAGLAFARQLTTLGDVIGSTAHAASQRIAQLEADTEPAGVATEPSHTASTASRRRNWQRLATRMPGFGRGSIRRG